MRKWLVVIMLMIGCLTQYDDFDITKFMEGVARGLHVERLAPSITRCANAILDVKSAVQDVIHAVEVHETLYNVMDITTRGLATFSPLARQCVIVPEDVWHHLQEDYFKKFDYDWEKYLHALFLNLGYKMDEIVTHVIQVKESFEAHLYYEAGYYSGETVNIVVNVTTQHPVPPPAPSDKVEPLVEEVQISSSKFQIDNIDWENVHKEFRRVYSYSMIALNYTKWINATTSNNLNCSVMEIEMKAYTALTELHKSSPDIREAVLTFIDISLYINKLFNGIYFFVLQLPEKALKDTVFEHITYFPLNLLMHVGYFIYDGYKLYEAIKNKDQWAQVRRITILVRKFLYFDDDVLDEIVKGVPFEEI